MVHLYPKADYFTGAAVQARELAQALHARGHHVLVVTRPSRAWEEDCAEAGLPHAALPMRLAVDLASAWGLARLLRRHRTEIVHCHKGKARTLTLLAGLLVRVPVLVLNRGVSFPVGRLSRLGYRHPGVTAVVAVCQSIKRGLVAAGVPPEKIEVIYSGTDLNRFHPGVDGSAVRRALGLGPGQALVTQVGVRSWRGNGDVLAAMARVREIRHQAHLLLVGAADPRIPLLLDQARHLGLEGAVTVWGKRRDVPEILAASDLVVDASHAGLGLTGAIREALAVETPVVATALEGMPELIADGETGLLVPPRDPEALARAILRAIDNPALARATARAGRKRVEAEFSLAVKVERIEALYRRLLGRARGDQA